MFNMLEKLFVSKTRVGILGLLIFSPKKEHHLRGIAKSLGMSAPRIKAELAKLESAGLVRKRHEGNLLLFRMNTESPIYDDLKRIFLKTECLGDLIRNGLPGGGKIRYALIYGSFASGREMESSDIDLLIVGSVKEDSVLRAIRGVEKRTGREINYIIWSEKEFREKAKEGNSLLRNIISNPVIMLMGDESEFREDAKG
jgi:predicted nucleotidyltransferase